VDQAGDDEELRGRDNGARAVCWSRLIRRAVLIMASITREGLRLRGS